MNMVGWLIWKPQTGRGCVAPRRKLILPPEFQNVEIRTIRRTIFRAQILISNINSPFRGLGPKKMPPHRYSQTQYWHPLEVSQPCTTFIYGMPVCCVRCAKLNRIALSAATCADPSTLRVLT